MTEANHQKTAENVKEYYGKTLQSTKDLQTSAATITIRDTASQRKKEEVAAISKLVHDKVKERYYGCGLVTPDELKDQTILDLGCGSGMDSYILAKMVGPNGFVVGIDMTEELLEVARQCEEYHRDVFGYKKSNVEFKNGFIEDLNAAGIGSDSQSLIVSNGVVNLTSDKKAVFSEIYRVLKPGGELFFSDVYCDKTIPEDLKKNKALWGECISGALQWEELHRLAAEVGLSTPVLLQSSESKIENEDLKKLVDGYKFVYAVYRVFKIDETPGSGSVDVTYNGGIEYQENEIQFSSNITFKKGCSLNVPAEVASILMKSRCKGHFSFGNFEKKEPEMPLVLNPFAEGVMKPACCS